jgi:hypothetical protein
MTVRELIDFLAALDPDLSVFVDGYEGGMTIPKPRTVDVALNVNTSSYCGEHEEVGSEWERKNREETGAEIGKGLLLGREEI